MQFPISELKPGSKIKGKTAAELGNRNRPLDMIAYRKDGKDYLLLANSNRGVMKISTDNIENADKIEAPVGSGTKGQTYETIAGWTAWLNSTSSIHSTRSWCAVAKEIR